MTDDEIQAYLEMRKLIERAAWIDGIAKLGGSILLLVFVCLIVKWLGL